GGPEEEQAALALAARLLELLARLPQRDHARDLLLGLLLAADVVELDAPVRVAGLVRLHLLDAEEEERAEEDREVDEEQQRQLEAEDQQRRQERRKQVAQRAEGVEQGDLGAAEPQHQVQRAEQGEQDQRQPEQAPEPRAPVP